MSLGIKRGEVHAIIGPNGSGKTTLLRVLTRNLKPTEGQVYLDNLSIREIGAKAVAKRMAVLNQSHAKMNDATVRELVSYGRFSHRAWWQGFSEKDTKIVDDCMQKTGLTAMEEKKLSQLSGGESQRAWIAMALAQKPELLVLDEPTTFLDIAHQLEVMELIARLNREEGLTILMVLHDINHAARYADAVTILKSGKLMKHGNPVTVLNQENVQACFGVSAIVTYDQESKKPMFYPDKVVRSGGMA